MKKVFAIGFALGLCVAACTAQEPQGVETTSTSLARPTTTIPPELTSTTVSQDDIEAALALGELYIEAHNGTEAEAVMALIAPSAGFGDSFTGSGNRAFWGERLVWNQAQGTQLTGAVCSVLDMRSSEVRISCEHGTHDSISQAVEGPPVPTVTILTVSSGEIVDLFERYSDPDFNHVGAPFYEWLAAHHPDVAASGLIGFGDWSNEEEARENGLLIREHAALWAAYLEENGCTYRQGC